jgi:hypothetical protein
LVACTSRNATPIDEVSDGRCPFRHVRHHVGITSFGVNAWTARDAGGRIINEHDESEPDSGGEMYLVVSGRAVFELDGERVPAPAGTFVFAPPGVKRTAFAEEPETTVIGARPARSVSMISVSRPVRPSSQLWHEARCRSSRTAPR